MTAEGSSRVSRIAATFDGSRTRLARLAESGHLRLRLLRGPNTETLLVNTGGGIVGGDCHDIALHVREGASVTWSTAAAERCYRSAGADAAITATLALGNGASLHWLPQETILFDGARVRRSLSIEMASGAAFVGAEMIVYGRLAHGEAMATGSFRDSCRLRRAGRLVFADETNMVAPVDVILDRAALSGGARAVALLLAASDDIKRLLEPLRASLAPFSSGDDAVEHGASARDGVLVARLLSRSPQRLRACVVAAVGTLRHLPLPRGWS